MVPDAYVYSYEAPIINPVVAMVGDAFAYSYEMPYITPVAQPVADGYVFSFENVILNPTNFSATQDAFDYSYEHVTSAASPNPTSLKVWDGTQWVTKPYYVWNGSAWVQLT